MQLDKRFGYTGTFVLELASDAPMRFPGGGVTIRGNSVRISFGSVIETSDGFRVTIGGTSSLRLAREHVSRILDASGREIWYNKDLAPFLDFGEDTG